MLRPFLIIGVGGSGGKTIRGLRHMLSLRLEQAGWDRGIPEAWQMIHFDTPVSQDGTDYVMPFLPATDYKGLVAGGSSYEGVFQSIVHGQKIAAEQMSDVQRMLPDPSRVPVDVTKGAGQFRAVGRAVVLSKLEEVSRAASDAVKRMTDASAIGELASLGERLGAKQHGGAVNNPTVIVVSSIAGGSGAGQYLDVIEAVKENYKEEPWAHQFFALLYAPDVFDQIKGAAGIVANALATVSEAANGFWTRNPSPATVELFRSRGLSLATNDARARVGAAFPLVIGRANSKVSFDNQGEVYSAVSTSIAAWMTDDKVQGDIDEYATTNWNANVGADVLPDATRLMRPLDQAPPFSSLGFGRVTLGREKFLDYAGERFARSVIDRMLFAHTEEDPRFEVRTEEEWIEHLKAQAFDGFIKEARLDEEGIDRNDVIDGLRPEAERQRLAADFREEVRSRTGQGLDKSGGLDISGWSHQLLTVRDDILHRYLSRDTANLSQHVNAWVEETPAHVIDTVERAIARHGLPVTVTMLGELSRVLKAASTELEAESQQHEGWLSRLPGLVNQELSEAANQESIRPDQTAVENALDRIEQSFEWQAEAALRLVASRLLGELRDDFIDPLRLQLESATQALLAEVKAPKLRDGRDNDFDFWPKRNSDVVPRKFTPAPNERLLVEHTRYPEEFDRLVQDSFGKLRFEDAMLRAVTDLITGPEPEQVPDERERWSTIEIRRTWRPRTTGDVGQIAVQTSTPRFDFSDDPQVYVERAKRWMFRKGTPFSAYIAATLLEFFDKDEVDPNEYRRRREAFREGLTAALGTSEPLVKLNPALLSEVHRKSIGDGNRLVFSSIPFPAGSDMYDATKAALTAAGVWDDSISPGWFKDAKVDAIEVFAMSGFPYQPVVMDSIMKPIAKGWLAESTSANSRASFWKWKRARLLREAVPMDPEVFDAMLRGWYVAKVLGQLDIQSRDDQERGPKLGVWDQDRRDFAWFPHPLLYPGIVPPQDFPGAVMESSIIALPLVNSEGSLAPLRAYHVLLDLGGRPNQLGTVLTRWLQDGRMPEGSPAPDPVRAGSADGSLAERQDAVRARLDAELQEFRDYIVKQDTQTSVYSYPVTWEIRSTVEECLKDLRNGVLDTKPDLTGI